MRRAGAAILGLAATAALAETPEGCWRRDYDAAHLAAQPAQTVTRLAVRLAPYESEHGRWSEALVEAHFRDDPETYVQWLHCWVPTPGEGLTDGAPAGALLCGVDCDGGTFVAWERAPGELLLRTEGFVVAGGCGAPILDADGEPIAEPPTRHVEDDGPGATTFLLRAAPLAACPGPR